MIDWPADEAGSGLPGPFSVQHRYFGRERRGDVKTHGKRGISNKVIALMTVMITIFDDDGDDDDDNDDDGEN